jgi:N-acetylglucosamine kinase-like BadF-type ATPase
MILIAESGATKTDWRILDDQGGIKQAISEGLNPYQQSFESIRDKIKTEILPQVDEEDISRIYFYGAGCATEEGRNVISKALKDSFALAEIEVNTDILAAARGLCGHEEGIACILGTGSNSCFYNGREIVENVPPLGFIIADEGSGAYMGKTLIADFLRKDMPEELREKFMERYNLDRTKILDKVYNQERAGKYLAGFTKFIYDNIKESYMHKLVYESFNEFFTRNILKYDNYQNYKVHFTGGVAFYFNEILRKVASDQGVLLQKITENPIAGLTLYHKPT